MVLQQFVAWLRRRPKPSQEPEYVDVAQALEARGVQLAGVITLEHIRKVIEDISFIKNRMVTEQAIWELKYDLKAISDRLERLEAGMVTEVQNIPASGIKGTEGTEYTRPFRERQVLELAREKGTVCTRDVALALGLDSSNASKYLTNLLRAGMLVKIGIGTYSRSSAAGP